MRAVVAIVLAAMCACRSTPKAAPEPRAPAPEPLYRVIAIGDGFSPVRGDSALAAWRPDIQPFDSGGVCNVARPYGPGVTIVTAHFPANDSTARTTLSITFDSAGHVVRFSDRRGLVRFRTTPGSSLAQADSARRAADAGVRTTSISFDYPINQALAVNSGGGRPTVAVIGTIRSMEDLEKLGPPTKRIQRLRRLCGV